MVEFKLKINEKQGTAYFPKEIREILGTKLKGIPNAAAMLLYPEGTDQKDVLKSIDIIRSDLEHQINMIEKEHSK
jgi:hypothetical protein